MASYSGLVKTLVGKNLNFKYFSFLNYREFEIVFPLNVFEFKTAYLYVSR